MLKVCLTGLSLATLVSQRGLFLEHILTFFPVIQKVL